MKKARATDRRMKVREGIVGPVETKLLSLGNVAGIVLGKGEEREVRTEEGERAVVVSALRRRLGVLAVKCQASSLLGRLEILGPGGGAARGQRQQASELEGRWRREAQAQQLAFNYGWRALRTGFARVEENPTGYNGFHTFWAFLSHSTVQEI